LINYSSLIETHGALQKPVSRGVLQHGTSHGESSRVLGGRKDQTNPLASIRRGCDTPIDERKPKPTSSTRATLASISGVSAARRSSDKYGFNCAQFVRFYSVEYPAKTSAGEQRLASYGRRKLAA